MSKLYNQYKILKKENPEKYFLFKNGLFFIFLDDDAKLMSQLLNLKLSALNANVVKCGFPENALDKYMYILNKLLYEVEIIIPKDNIITDYNSYKFKDLIKEILDTEVDKLSISEAYDFLNKIQSEFSKLNCGDVNETKEKSL